MLHVGDALDDLNLLLTGQAHEDFARLLRRQVREDQCDRLWVLVLNERQQVFRFGLLEERERRRLHLLGHLLDDAVGFSRGKFLIQIIELGSDDVGFFIAANDAVFFLILHQLLLRRFNLDLEIGELGGEPFGSLLG